MDILSLNKCEKFGERKHRKDVGAAACEDTHTYFINGTGSGKRVRVRVRVRSLVAV